MLATMVSNGFKAASARLLQNVFKQLKIDDALVRHSSAATQDVLAIKASEIESGWTDYLLSEWSPKLGK